MLLGLKEKQTLMFYKSRFKVQQFKVKGSKDEGSRLKVQRFKVGTWVVLGQYLGCFRVV